jgi:hypothetical protein
MQEHEERVASGIRLDSAQPAEPGGIASGVGKLREAL